MIKKYIGINLIKEENQDMLEQTGTNGKMKTMMKQKIVNYHNLTEWETKECQILINLNYQKEKINAAAVMITKTANVSIIITKKIIEYKNESIFNLFLFENINF